MPARRRIHHLVLVYLLLLPLSGCLFRSRKVESRITTMPLKEATQAELVERINREAEKIKTLNATVDITPTVGGPKKGKETEYTDIRGYILVRKPSMLRMVGLFPIVRNRAFDMVSDGQDFKVSIPPKSRFIIGRNDVVYPSKQPLENLRPQHIFDALLLHEIRDNEIAVLEGTTTTVRDKQLKKDVEEPQYTLIVLHRNGEGQWALSRKIVFSRITLEPYRQIVYDKLGNVATDATYADFQEFSGAQFPAKINIQRPQEEYAIELKIVKLTLNQPLKDEQFALQQPEGYQVVRLDRPPEQRASDGQPPQTK